MLETNLKDNNDEKSLEELNDEQKNYIKFLIFYVMSWL